MACPSSATSTGQCTAWLFVLGTASSFCGHVQNARVSQAHAKIYPPTVSSKAPETCGSIPQCELRTLSFVQVIVLAKLFLGYAFPPLAFSGALVLDPLGEWDWLSSGRGSPLA